MDFLIEIHPGDGFLEGEIRFRISRSIAKSAIRISKSKSGFPNRTQPCELNLVPHHKPPHQLTPRQPLWTTRGLRSAVGTKDHVFHNGGKHRTDTNESTSSEELCSDFLQILSFDSAYAGSSSQPKTGMVRQGEDHCKHNKAKASVIRSSPFLFEARERVRE